MSERRKSYIEQICPECVFQPTYPQIFKFDLVLKSQNYGELEIVINEGTKIAEIKGDKRAVLKLEEVAKSYKGQVFEVPFVITHEINYPFKSLMDLSVLFAMIEFSQTKEQNEAISNKDYYKMLRFNKNMFSPIDEKLLYEKTGIKIQY